MVYLIIRVVQPFELAFDFISVNWPEESTVLTGQSIVPKNKILSWPEAYF